MRTTEYQHTDGRLFQVLIPDSAPDSDAPYGVVVGPPEHLVERLGLPPDVGVRLHNEFYHRRLFTLRDILNQRESVVSALHRVLALDTERIIEVYRTPS